MSLVNDARALLRQFLNTDYKALHASTARIDIFFSRDPDIRADLQEASGAADAETTKIFATAPHLGTIAALSPQGERVAAGGAYGRIRVLDEESDLISEHEGVIAGHRCKIGDLVEYRQPIVALETA